MIYFRGIIMLKLRTFAITFTTVGYLLLGNSYLPSLEALPATPSRGTAGSTSGAGTTGSSALNTLLQNTGNTGSITTNLQNAVNSVGSQVINNLIQAGGAGSLIVSLLGTSVSNNISSAGTFFTNIQGNTTSTPITLSNGVQVFTAINRVNTSALITVNGPGITPSTSTISITGVANPQGAIAAAAAVLASGGTSVQAELAAALVGANPTIAIGPVLQLISALTGLANIRAIQPQGSLPMTDLRSSLDNSTNLNPRIEEKSLREKSFESTLPTLISQGKGVTVNAEKLSQAIRAYNNLIDTSSPEALQALSKNKEFTTIGDSLRKLRVSLDTYALNR